MTLIRLTESSHNILIDLRYASPNNFTGKVIYESKDCWIHPQALVCLENAINLADQQGLKLKILDAYRPQRAQEKLWRVCPNPMYVAPPMRGSNHTKGIALDLTLVDATGCELDMGTPFDDFSSASHHGSTELSAKAAENRYKLLGIMMSAGWDFYQNEWWHYQLFKPEIYPLIPDLSDVMLLAS